MSVNEILKCDRPNESYWAIYSCSAVYYAVQAGFNFVPVDEILKCDHSNESYWAVLSCSAVYYAVQAGFNFVPVDEILKCDHQMKATEQYFPVVLFIMLYKVILTLKSLSLTIQVKALLVFPYVTAPTTTGMAQWWSQTLS